MTRCFKKSIIVFIFSAILLTALCVNIFGEMLVREMQNPGVSYRLFTLLLLIAFALEAVVIISAFVSEAVALKENRRLLDILYRDCDPLKFIKLYSPLLEKNVGKKAKRSIIASMAAALNASGDFKGAADIYEKICAEPVQKKNVLFAAVNYLDLSTIYYDSGDIDSAKRNYDKAMGYLSACKENMLLKRVMEMSKDIRNKIFIGTNQLDKALSYFKDELMPGNSRYREVAIHDSLASIYEKLGDEEKEREHLRFVAENGGTLYIADKARKNPLLAEK